MARRYYKLPTILLLAIMLFAAPGVLRGQGGSRVIRQDRCKDGVYNAKVGGYYTGTGTADVAADRVVLDITVKTADGATGRLRGTFPTNGPYFGGNGNIMRGNIVVRGRVDAARASRVVATFWDDTGHAGRIYGTLPSDPGDETWNQEK
jgi:hypothetical protein